MVVVATKMQMYAATADGNYAICQKMPKKVPVSVLYLYDNDFAAQISGSPV
jgi:hypothetical protein